MRWIIRLDKYQIVHHHNKVPLIPFKRTNYKSGQNSFGQYCIIHIFLSFLGQLLKQCIIFKIFLQFSLRPPFTKLKHGKNSGFTRPTLFEGWGEGLDLFELENAPEMRTCSKTFVHDCSYLYNFSTPYWYPPQINIISSKKQLECFLKGGANSSIYAITHKIQRLLAYLPALSCASTLAPFCSSNSTIRAIPSDEVIVRELLGSEVADADQGLCTAQDYQCNYSS